MRITNQLDHQQRLREKLQRIYSRARQNRPTSDELQDQNMTIWDDPYFRKLPYARREYLRGYRDALDSALWFDCVIWRLGPAEGPLSAEETDKGWEINGIPGILSRLARDKGSLYGGHFWIGTDKVFTAYRCTNGGRP